MAARSVNALIVFVKNPVKGKVKTRIAADAGEIRALNIYHKLLAHTSEISQGVNADVHIFYSDALPDNKEPFAWAPFHHVQQGDDLGARMSSAFDLLLSDYKRVVIIGSDCAELTSAGINLAFEALTRVDNVIGPAHDGGYYLLGLREPAFSVFRNMPWSTPEVFGLTVSRLLESDHEMYLLEKLSDVDYLSDWKNSPLASEA